jgi:hypothetical protein
MSALGRDLTADPQTSSPGSCHPILSVPNRSFMSAASLAIRPAPGLPLDPCLRRFALGAKLSQQDLEHPALLAHVIVAIVVTRLHASQAVRLEVTSNLAADAVGGQQGLDP